MFQVVPSQGEEKKLRAVADAAGEQRVAVRYPASYGRGPWFHEFVEVLQRARPGAAFVRIPTEPDRVERALLELASNFGRDHLAAVAEALREEPNSLSGALRCLDNALDGATVIVDGWSALRVSDDTYDAGHALDERFRDARNWLADHACVISDYEFDPPPGFAETTIRLPDAEDEFPPTTLRNGRTYPRPDLWKRFAPDVGAYNSALAMLALQESPDAKVTPPAWKIRDHVASRLPGHALELLFLLGVHARPLDNEALSVLGVEQSARELLVHLGICESLPSGIALDPAWTVWCVDELGSRKRDYHSQLANAFAGIVRPDDQAADRAALAVLEAHRHFVALGDDQRARRFARYSAALLVEEGKRRSLERRFDDAARLYESVLSLADKSELPLPPRLRGYVTHYTHFNRAMARTESIAETERGYAEALREWPANALFWSRLVRTQFYAGKSAAALKTLERALDTVEPHPDKEPVLIARTVRGLLKRYEHEHDGELLVDASFVWGDYKPTSSASRDVEHLLRHALETGWLASKLALPNETALAFVRPQFVKVTYSGHWVAELEKLDIISTAETPDAALTNLIHEACTEAKSLVAALTHTLDAETRLRKQVLMGAIDVVASGLDARSPEHLWVVGDLVRDDGKVWLRTRGSRDLWFEVPEPLASAVIPSDMPYLAEVVGEASGIPVGPVLQLVATQGTTDQIWQEWRRRMNGDN